MKQLSGNINRLQIQIGNDGFTPPNSTNNKWTKLVDPRATFKKKTKLVEHFWKQNYFLKKLFLHKVTSETIFSSPQINQSSDQSSACDEKPYAKTTKRSNANVKYSSCKNFVLSQIHFTPPNRKKIFMRTTINHNWKQARLYCPSRKVYSCTCCSFANLHQKSWFCIFQLN